MPRPNRCDIVDPDKVGYYHCYSRCVRRAFLCGWDKATGKDYSHRKKWVVDRQVLLAQVFAIELVGYAIMDDHMHHVLRTRPDIAKRWSDEEVVRRWCQLHPRTRNEDGSPAPLWREPVRPWCSAWSRPVTRGLSSRCS